MRNFLQETIDAITGSGHRVEDVMFVGSGDGKLRKSYIEFSKIANFEYDNRFGGQEIATDLIVYFTDSTYIVRDEYDDSEWWKYNKPLKYTEEDTYNDYSVLKNESSWNTLEDTNTNS